MEFRDVVRRRRMVRNYTSERVDDEVIRRIIDVARRAPSAGFSQGFYFIVITDDSTRAALAALAGEAEYVAQGFDPWMSRAPVHIAVCVREDDYHERYRQPDKIQDDGTEIDWPVPYWYVDGGAATMLLLLAAVDEGLAAGFFGFHRLGGMKELLSIPDDVAPLGVVTLGHRASDRRSGSLSRGRKARERVVFRDRWGSTGPA